MQVYQCCNLIKESYNAIASAELGFVATAITCTVKTLDNIAANESLPMEVRKEAAFAAATLLISDHRD